MGLVVARQQARAKVRTLVRPVDDEEVQALIHGSGRNRAHGVEVRTV